MGAEKKSTSSKFEASASTSLKKKFGRHCRKLNVSMAQRIRDLVQKDMREKGR